MKKTRFSNLSPYKRILIVSVAISSIFFLSGCDFFKGLVFQVIGKNIMINQDWIEIHPTSPLEPSRQSQDILITIQDLSGWDLGHDAFIMPDGKEIKIDVVLIAEDGSQFLLKDTGFGGATPDGGLRLSYLPKEGSKYSEYKASYFYGSFFPKNTKFTTVRIRSNIPLQTNKIYWVCTVRY